MAALVGVSEPVIFQNFGSKAALFAAVVDRVADDVPGGAGPAGRTARIGRRGCWRTRSSRGICTAHPHAARPHGFGAHGVLFSDAFALIGEPELTEAARRAARTIAGHLADLIRRGQADGDIRADLDPEPVAWLLLSVLSTRAFRAAVTPDHDRVEAGVTALALRLLAPALGSLRAARSGLAGRASRRWRE